MIWAVDDSGPGFEPCHCGNHEPHDRDECDESAAAKYADALAKDLSGHAVPLARVGLPDGMQDGAERRVRPASFHGA